MMMSPGLRVGLGYPDEDLIIKSYGSMPYPGSSSRDYPHIGEGGGYTPPFKGLNTKASLPQVAGKTLYYICSTPRPKAGQGVLRTSSGPEK